MTNHLQTQSRIPTTITYRRILACRIRNNDQSKTDDKEKWRETDISSSLHRVSFLYSNLIGDTNQTRRYAKEFVYHDRSTYELRYDGSIIITPYSRQLPHEIISLIIHQLSINLAEEHKTLFQCTLVSRQFFAIVNPLLWKVLDFHCNVSAERFLACLADASPWQVEAIGRHIRELYLHGQHWKDAPLIRLLPYLRRLKYLTIDDDTSITDKSFKRIPYRCPHLISLRLDLGHLTQLSFASIGKHCRQLCHLVWNIKKSQSSEWLEMITPLCPLKHLQIKALAKPLHHTVFTTIKTFHRLTCIDIVDTNSSHMNDFLQQQQNIATAGTSSPPPCMMPLWPYLTKLTLYPCNELENATVISFIKSHSYLKELHLMKATRLTNRALNHMALPNLMHLTLTDNDNISPEGIRRMIHQCGRLTYLELQGCLHVMPSAFPELWELHDKQDIVMNHRIICRIRQYKSEKQRPLDDKQRRLADMVVQRLQLEEEQRQRQRQLEIIRQQIQQRQQQIRRLRRQEHELVQVIQQHQQLQ